MIPEDRGRRAGILVPLFSIPSQTSWGIGEIPDLGTFAGWLARGRQRLVQLLPLSEMPPGETSPYSALSAMAIDPQFIALAQVPEFDALGGEASLLASERVDLERVRASTTVSYASLRALKATVLRRAWTRFREGEASGETARGLAFRRYCDAQAWWLDDYAVYRALRARHGEQAWTDWPPPLRERQPEALAAAGRELADDIGFRRYLQWLAHDQWEEVRRGLRGVAIFGDLPFMVSADSADVWARQHEFRLDVSVGVPPDAFSETGQDWGLPAYRWDVMAVNGFAWLRDRARRYASLYDGFRVDHLVGFYRTFFRTAPGVEGAFTPADQAVQLRLGESVLDVLRGAGAEVTAEDLGTVPDFVRESLARQDIAGYKVFRWERAWKQDSRPYIEPASYPERSVATSGTHDTEPMTLWWEHAPASERGAVLALPWLAERLPEDERRRAVESPVLSDTVREALLELLYASGSNLLILPVQDVFGWPDRINQPATVNDRNWTWCLPWTVDRLEHQADAVAVARRLRLWAERHGR